MVKKLSAKEAFTYKNSDVLINKADIRDPAALELFEYAQSALRAHERVHDFTPDLDGLKKVHRLLFQDVYPWAGKTRDEPFAREEVWVQAHNHPLWKGPRAFGESREIDADLRLALAEAAGRLETAHRDSALSKGRWAEITAEQIGRINDIHPFRDGNGRAMRAFIEHAAARYGFAIALDRMSAEAWFALSAQAAAGELKPLVDEMMRRAEDIEGEADPDRSAAPRRESLASPVPVKSEGLVVGLNAVIVAVDQAEPKVLIAETSPSGEAALPFGPFDPKAHRTFEMGLRAWVREQTGFELGYVEQLYTFGDRGREAPLAALAGVSEARVISVGYLALAPEARPLEAAGAVWAGWPRFFPWEDHRAGRPAILTSRIEPALRAWADEAPGAARRAARYDRARLTFGLDGAAWNEERTLERYELLYEAGLAPEAVRDGGGNRPHGPLLGEPMASDHRRILATAVSRLRGKVKYRPVVFELLGPEFTLSHLQKVMEGIVGHCIHKQNFRRALERTGFVEPTGEMEAKTGGRPAALYRFRREALREVPALGLPAPRLAPL